MTSVLHMQYLFYSFHSNYNYKGPIFRPIELRVSLPQYIQRLFIFLWMSMDICSKNKSICKIMWKMVFGVFIRHYTWLITLDKTGIKSSWFMFSVQQLNIIIDSNHFRISFFFFLILSYFSSCLSCSIFYFWSCFLRWGWRSM